MSPCGDRDNVKKEDMHEEANQSSERKKSFAIHYTARLFINN